MKLYEAFKKKNQKYAKIKNIPVAIKTMNGTFTLNAVYRSTQKI